MHLFLKIWLETLILTIILSIGIFGQSNKSNTIVTKDGERIENVEFAVDYSFHVLFIEKLSRNISFHNIDTVYSENGIDITKFVLEEEGYTNPKITELAWKFGISLGANASFPFGSIYAEEVPYVPSADIGYDIGLLTNINNTLNLKLTLSKSGLSGESGSESSDWNVWKYQMAIQYLPFGYERSRSSISAYLNGGLGIINQKSKKEIKFSFNFGGGGYYAITKVLYLYMGGEYNIFFGKTASGTNGVGSIFDIKTGISIFL